MSSNKKRISQQFRDTVFDRDGHKCRACGWSLVTSETSLDAHHITDRNLIPNGDDYVKENGVSLYPGCHLKAEHFRSIGMAHPGFSPENLYAMIGSSSELTVKASERLK